MLRHVLQLRIELRHLPLQILHFLVAATLVANADETVSFLFATAAAVVAAASAPVAAAA